MFRHPKFSVVICLSVLFAAVTVARGQNLRTVAEVEGITEYRLGNGIPVLLFSDGSRPQFTVNMTVFVGSRHEGYGETGMAHLLEHMLFKGTAQHPDIPKLLKDRGVLNMNGTTWLDRTNYYETLPASDDNLEFAIRMEADRLVNSLIRAEDLASEMTVVRNEFEMGENSPFRILLQRIMASAYEWHNYGKSTIGNRSDIERVPVQNLRDFYTKYYQPDNVSVVVAGQFDTQKALEYLEKYFGSLEMPARQLPKTWTEEPVQDGERIVRLQRVGDIQMAGVAWHIPAAAHADTAAFEVLQRVLGLEPAGRLYQALVRPGLASSVTVESLVGHDPGLLIAFAEVPKEQSLETAQSVLLATVDEVASGGVTDDEVKRAVERILKEREQEFADSERVAIQLSEWQAYGDWRLYFLHRDRIEKVTAADVQRVAGTYLIASNRTIGQFIPVANPVRARIPSAPSLETELAGYRGRTKIAAGEKFEPTPENIDARTIRGRLDVGLEYALLPRKTRGERVFVSGKLQYGTLESLRGQRLAASQLADMLSRGTNSRTFQELRDRLDAIRTSISFSGEPGELSFTLQTKREHLPAALDLLREMLREPAFPASEFEIVRTEAISGLEANRSEPQTQVMFAMQRALSPWEKDDPRYRPDIDESLQELRAADVESIRALHQRFLGAAHGQVGVVGDFDPATLPGLLDGVFRGWTSSESWTRIPQPFHDFASLEPVRINTPDKANAVYIAAQVMPIRDDAPDYEAALIGAYILGGGPLSSRLADRVRKQEGLSYAVGSMLRASSQDENGMLLMFAISNPANAPRVDATVREEVARLLESGVSADELANACSGYLETRKGDRSGESSLAEMLRENLELGRSMEFASRSDARIAGLTVEQVNETLRQRIKPDRTLVIMAGDFDSDSGTQTGDSGQRESGENAGGGE